MQQSEIKLQIEQSHIGNIFGDFDANIKLIEKYLDVVFVPRDDHVKIIGSDDKIIRAGEVIKGLYLMSKKGAVIGETEVNYMLDIQSENKKVDDVSGLSDDVICYTLARKPIVPKTFGQKEYVSAIKNDMITFGVGPAGTGKTYLAMALAIAAFQRGEVSRIILTRPAIEAGEKLGFLPGDMQSKVDPYLRPLYDVLYLVMGAENFAKHMERGEIEVAPLAYMRGRTLENSFIILDEAQNTTPAQMKMFLTRIGFGSKAVITGDLTQKDLAADAKSGLDEALSVLSKIDGISICELSSKDVVRHPLVQRIVNAYEDYEKKSKPRKRNESKRPRSNS